MGEPGTMAWPAEIGLEESLESLVSWWRAKHVIGAIP